MHHNKTRQQGRFAPGPLYSGPCLKRYAAILRGRYVIGVVDSIALPELQRVNAW